MPTKITLDGATWDLEELIEQHPKNKPLTPDGRELLDPTPMAPPVGYKRQPSLAEQIREMVRSERLAADLEAAGYETFDEAEDFEIGDDYDPTSPYEQHFDPTPVAELRRRRDQDVADQAKKGAPPANPPAGPEPKNSEGPEGGSDAD